MHRIPKSTQPNHWKETKSHHTASYLVLLSSERTPWRPRQAAAPGASSARTSCSNGSRWATARSIRDANASHQICLVLCSGSRIKRQDDTPMRIWTGMQRSISSSSIICFPLLISSTCTRKDREKKGKGKIDSNSTPFNLQRSIWFRSGELALHFGEPIWLVGSIFVWVTRQATTKQIASG